LSGIFIFIPQIAILFFLITVLEEVGYMARVVFMFDKTMRRFGMNGRSIVSLISGGACAVPAIMSSRTIGNWKERLITTMVTPFISCSARLPVYAVLIGLAVPAKRIFGVLSSAKPDFWKHVLVGRAGGFCFGVCHEKSVAHARIVLFGHRITGVPNSPLEKPLADCLGKGIGLRDRRRQNNIGHLHHFVGIGAVRPGRCHGAGEL
jgi:hypothetical protein